MSTPIEKVTLVEILPTKIWVESDLFGSRHVMVQHQGMKAFRYASFFYGYGYTSNGGTLAAAEAVALSLGARQPIDHRQVLAPSFAKEDRND